MVSKYGLDLESILHTNDQEYRYYGEECIRCSKRKCLHGFPFSICFRISDNIFSIQSCLRVPYVANLIYYTEVSIFWFDMDYPIHIWYSWTQLLTVDHNSSYWTRRLITYYNDYQLISLWDICCRLWCTFTKSIRISYSAPMVGIIGHILL